MFENTPKYLQQFTYHVCRLFWPTRILEVSREVMTSLDSNGMPSSIWKMCQHLHEMHLICLNSTKWQTPSPFLFLVYCVPYEICQNITKFLSSSCNCQNAFKNFFFSFYSMNLVYCIFDASFSWVLKTSRSFWLYQFQFKKYTSFSSTAIKKPFDYCHMEHNVFKPKTINRNNLKT